MTANRLVVDSGVSALAPMVWGSTYLVTTEFLPEDSPLLAAVVRALPAGLILLAFSRSWLKGVWWWRAFVLGTLNIGAFFYLLFLAAYHLPGGVAALVGTVQPMIVLILAALLLGDRIKPVHVGACLLGSCGVALLVLRSSVALDAVGVVAALAGALSMASGIVLTKRWGRPEGVGVLQFTGWQLTVGGLVLLPFMLTLEGLPSSVNGTNLLGFTYLTLVGSVFGYVVWFRGIDRLPALAVSFLSFASPLVATLLGWVFLEQGLTALQILGAATLVAAVVLVQPRPARQGRGQPAPPRPVPVEPQVNRT